MEKILSVKMNKVFVDASTGPNYTPYGGISIVSNNILVAEIVQANGSSSINHLEILALQAALKMKFENTTYYTDNLNAVRHFTYSCPRSINPAKFGSKIEWARRRSNSGMRLADNLSKHASFMELPLYLKNIDREKWGDLSIKIEIMLTEKSKYDYCERYFDIFGGYPVHHKGSSSHSEASTSP